MDNLNEPTVDDFVDLFGLNPPADPPAPAGDPAPTDPPGDPNPAPAPAPGGDPNPTDPPEPKPGDPPADPPEPPAPAPAPTPEDKTGKAFAEMRVQNNQYKKTLNTLASVLKIDSNLPPEQMMQQIQNTLSGVLAKQTGVPAEMLQRLEQLEEINGKYQQERLYSKSQTELIEIRDRYKLDDKGVEDFMSELLRDGKNPLVQEIDLMQEYVNRHHEDITKKAVEDAIRAEQQRAAAAAANGTTPPAASGGNPPAPGDTKISSVRDLDTYFKGLTI